MLDALVKCRERFYLAVGVCYYQGIMTEKALTVTENQLTEREETGVSTGKVIKTTGLLALPLALVATRRVISLYRKNKQSKQTAIRTKPTKPAVSQKTETVITHYSVTRTIIKIEEK